MGFDGHSKVQSFEEMANEQQDTAPETPVTEAKTEEIATEVKADNVETPKSE